MSRKQNHSSCVASSSKINDAMQSIFSSSFGNSHSRQMFFIAAADINQYIPRKNELPVQITSISLIRTFLNHRKALLAREGEKKKIPTIVHKEFLV